MGEPFTIKSVRSDAELAFVAHEGDYFTVAVRGSEIAATRRVWGYTDCDLLVDLFQHLAKQTHGPIDLLEWGSIEHDFSLAVRGDKLGHVFIVVAVHHHTGAEDWSLKREIETELGQLSRIASAMARFFFS